MTVSQVLQKAVLLKVNSGITRHSIAKGAGVQYSTLVRWLDEGRDIRASTLDAIAEYVGFELRPIHTKKKS